MRDSISATVAGRRIGGGGGCLEDDPDPSLDDPCPSFDLSGEFDPDSLRSANPGSPCDFDLSGCPCDPEPPSFLVSGDWIAPGGDNASSRRRSRKTVRKIPRTATITPATVHGCDFIATRFACRCNEISSNVCMAAHSYPLSQPR